MIPEYADRSMFRTHVLAKGFEHRMYRIKRWRKENQRAFQGGIWIAHEPCLDCVVLKLFGEVRLSKGEKVKRVPLPLFEKWLNNRVAREITGKS